MDNQIVFEMEYSFYQIKYNNFQIQMRRQDYIPLCAEPVQQSEIILTVDWKSKWIKIEKGRWKRSFDFWQGKKGENGKMESESDKVKRGRIS